MATTVDFVHAYTAVNNSGLIMLKKKLLKKTVVIGMMATMITGCSQEVQTTHVDSLNS